MDRDLDMISRRHLLGLLGLRLLGRFLQLGHQIGNRLKEIDNAFDSALFLGLHLADALDPTHAGEPDVELAFDAVDRQQPMCALLRHSLGNYLTGFDGSFEGRWLQLLCDCHLGPFLELWFGQLRLSEHRVMSTRQIRVANLHWDRSDEHRLFHVRHVELQLRERRLHHLVPKLGVAVCRVLGEAEFDLLARSLEESQAVLVFLP